VQLGLTYFDVEYENQVDAYLSNLAILSLEPYFAGTGIILRGTEARDRVLQLLAQGVAPVGTFPGGSPANVNLFVDGRSQNLGLSKTQGLDFQGMYALDTDSLGLFTFSASGTWLFKYELAVTDTAPLVDRLNTIFNPLEFKLRAGVDWQNGPMRASATVTHVNGYTNNAITIPQSVGSYSPVDLAFSWSLGDAGSGPLDGLVAGIELRNAFDVDPPYVNIAPTANGSGGYDATASNPVGRLLGISLRKKW
jgi:iron complex outermembrane recepter protein